MNQGIRQASHPIICLVDQDVVLKPGWLAAVLVPFDDAAVGAVQGYFVTDLARENFGTIKTKHGHRVLELGVRFDF